MEEKKIVSYDPMTGAPIYEETAEEAKAADAVEATTEETVETPVTEQIETETPAQEAAPVAQVEPEYAMPEEAPQKKKTGLIVGIIAAVLVIAIAIVAVFMFLVKSPKDIVKEACDKTFENYANGDNLLFTAIIPKGFDKAEELTVSVEGSYEDTWYEEDASFDATITADEERCQIYGGFESSSEGIPYIEGVIDVTESQIKLASPMLQNVYVYDFTQECSGFLGELLEESGVDPDVIGEYMATVFEAAKASTANAEMYEDYIKKFEEVADNIEYEKIDSEEFTVDDKDVKCKGYKMIITEENMEEFMDVYIELIEEMVDEETFSSISEMTGDDLDYEEAIEELRDEMGDVFEDMDDIEINFYVYKNELAAITFDAEGEEISVEFQGGDYRAQNILMEVSGVKVKIESEKEDGVETFSLKVAKEEIFSYEYDSESGDLSFEIIDLDPIEGINILNEDGEWAISLDDFEVEDTVINGSFTIKKGAEFKDVDGDEFLLNDATEDELYEILMEEGEALSGLM